MFMDYLLQTVSGATKKNDLLREAWCMRFSKKMFEMEPL